MEDLLPNDAKLLQRKDLWLATFKKYSEIENEKEISLDGLSDVLASENDSEKSFDKENVPEEAQEGSDTEENTTLEEVQSNVGKQLQLAVKEREKQWNEKRLSLTFEKVDEWLKASEVQTEKRTIEPSGAKSFKSKQCKKMERKRLYRKMARPSESSNESEASNSFASDSSDAPSSVDTAQYILANQKRKTSKTTTTIIKKYIVTEKVHSNQDFKRIQSKPSYKAICDSSKRSHKTKNRKKKRELDRLHKSFTTNPETDSESEPVVRKRCKPSRNVSLSNNNLIDSKQMQPKVRISPSSRVNSLQGKTSTSAKKTDENTSNNTIPVNISSVTSSISVMNKSKSRLSTGTNSSKRLYDQFDSWSHLPKSVVIYQPNPDIPKDQKVCITNEHFEKALGVEAAQKYLDGYEFHKEIDNNSIMMLNIPTTEDENSSDSDILIEIPKHQPRLSIVSMEKKL